RSPPPCSTTPRRRSDHRVSSHLRAPGASSFVKRGCGSRGANTVNPHRRGSIGAMQGRDLTEGPIGRTLLVFALPILGGNVLQSLNGSVNAIWVGRFLGEQALTAIANANNVMFFLLRAIFGFGMASPIMIGQALGRQDLSGARKVIGSSVPFSLSFLVFMSRSEQR